MTAGEKHARIGKLAIPGTENAVFIPFRLKLLGAFLGLSAAVLLATLAVVSSRQRAAIEEVVLNRLVVARKVYDETLRLRERQLRRATRLLAQDFAFKQALATRDPATIASNAQSLRERIGSDVVWIADDEGVLYADTSRQLKRGANVARVGAVRGALEEGVGASVEAAGQEVYQLAGVAVNAPDLIGCLIAAFKLDDGLAAYISSQTNASVSFATEAGVFASTLDPVGRAVLQKDRAKVRLDRPALIGEPGRQELAMAVPVARGVHAYLQMSWDEAIEPLRRLQRVLGVLAAVALALTSIVGFFIADSVTASMRELAEATGKISEGDFTVRVVVRTRDEVGRLGAAFNAMVAGLQEREKIRSVLRKTVSKEIADELLKRGEINLGGEERLVTVLFSDIRSFTTISEDLDPPRLVSELNEYFGKMARAIEERRGVIDKFIGDAIMALFGAPIGSPDDAANALRAALAMRGALEELNASRAARGLPRWETGIGLNTGTAVAGTLGSENRLSYTVIGDAVNLASRLEGLTKHYGCPILLSADAREKAGAGFLHRSIDLVRVKGRHHAVDILELLGERVPPPPWLAGWEKAVAAYRSGALADARLLFEATAAAKPGDGPSAEYLARLAELPEKAAAGWDPAYTALEK